MAKAGARRARGPRRHLRRAVGRGRLRGARSPERSACGEVDPAGLAGRRRVQRRRAAPVLAVSASIQRAPDPCSPAAMTAALGPSCSSPASLRSRRLPDTDRARPSRSTAPRGSAVPLARKWPRALDAGFTVRARGPRTVAAWAGPE
jgi:hypothetical protein